MSCFNERLTPLHAIKSLHGRDLWRLLLLSSRQTHQRQRGRGGGGEGRKVVVLENNFPLALNTPAIFPSCVTPS